MRDPFDPKPAAQAVPTMPAGWHRTTWPADKLLPKPGQPGYHPRRRFYSPEGEFLGVCPSGVGLGAAEAPETPSRSWDGFGLGNPLAWEWGQTDSGLSDDPYSSAFTGKVTV
jgi:hypothetical protein